MAARSATINVMAKACYRAARGLLRDFGEVENLQVSKKGPADFVSNADRTAERRIVEDLEKARPGYGFLLEEGGERESTDSLGRRWIVDPLDGTTNFLHGIPHFCISIALEERNEIVAGTIYDPIKDELFWAERGQGAYLNDRRIRVSGRQQISEALFATGVPFLGHGDHERFLRHLPKVMASTAGVRRMGAAALDLAYVAAGRVEGFWELGLQPWDIAAGVLIAREAGARVSDTRGNSAVMRSGDVVAVTEPLYRHFMDFIRGADREAPRSGST
jgi:myo-inositol-1(or 4)-monophosphatase